MARARELGVAIAFGAALACSSATHPWSSDQEPGSPANLRHDAGADLDQGGGVDASKAPKPTGKDASTVTAGDDAGDPAVDPGTSDAGDPDVTSVPVTTGDPDAAAGAAPTWTEIYAADFGPGTPGSCTGCHATGAGGFQCSAQADCYDAFTGGSCPMVDPAASCLSWFAASGTMPSGGATPDPAALDAIRAWVAAGQPND